MLIHPPHSRRRACLIAALLAPATLAASPPNVVAHPQAAATALCAGEPMPVLDTPHTLRCALDFGIVGTGSDVTQQLSNALDTLKREQARLFLPAGTYGIRVALDLPAGTGLVGSTVGRTRLINHSDPWQLSANTSTLGLGGDPGSRDDTLVQQLHLDNVRMLVSPGGRVTIRRNVLRGLTSELQQLVLHGGGQRVVEDNVFWRESSTTAGVGIDVFTPTGMTFDGGTTIRNNLIGAVDLDKLGPGQAEVATQLARNAMDRQAPERLGHYTTAMRLFGSANTHIEGNVIASRAQFQIPLQPRPRFYPLAVFAAADHLTLIGNTFRGGPNRVVALASMSDVDVRQNIFFNARLRVDAVNGLPTKRTVVQDNWFRGKGVTVKIAVNGSGPDHTSPDDLSIIGNVVSAVSRSAVPPACGYRLRPPRAGTRNFAVEPGRGLSFATVPVVGEPAPACVR